MIRRALSYADRCRTLRRAVAVLCALLIGTPAAGQDAPTLLWNAETEVSGLDFEGNDTYGADVLTLQLETKAPSFFDKILNTLFFWRDERYPFVPLVLQKDVVRLRNFYKRNGFLRPEVDYDARLDTSDNRMDITFLIDEGPPLLIQELNFVGPDGRSAFYQMPEEMRPGWIRFRDEVAINVGERFVELDLVTFQDQVLSWLKNRGFAFAQTTADTTITSFASGARVLDFIDVTVGINTGPLATVDSIIVDGVESVPRRVVERELPLERGERFSYREMIEGQRQVFAIDLFGVALASLPEQPRDSTVTVRYQVREAPKRLITAQPGYSNQSGLGVQAQLTHRNFFGGARRFTVSGLWDTGFGANVAAGETPFTQVQLSFALRQPYVFVRRLSGVVRPFYESVNYTFDGARFGVETTALYEFYQFRNASVTHRVARENITVDSDELFEEALDSLGLTLEDLPGIDLDTLALPDLSTKERFWTSTLSLSGRFGRADSYLAPTRGFLVTPSIGVSVPPSDVQYVRLAAEAVVARPLTRSIGFGGRLRVGRVLPYGRSVDQDDPTVRTQFQRIRLYGGGADDVRGYGNNLLGDQRIVIGPSGNLAYDALGGLAKITGTAELRYPVPFLGPEWTVATFLDFGHVGDRFRLDPTAYKYSTGMGVRVRTPVGYVRLDAAYKINPDRSDLVGPGDFLEGKTNDSFLNRIRFHLNFGPWI